VEPGEEDALQLLPVARCDVKDQTPQARLSPCSDLGAVDARATMLRTGMVQWRGKAASVLLLQRNQGEMSFIFVLFCLDSVFTSGLTKLFQLLSFPHKDLESLGGCLPSWPSEVKPKGDEHYVPVQLVEL